MLLAEGVCQFIENLRYLLRRYIHNLWTLVHHHVIKSFKLLIKLSGSTLPRHDPAATLPLSVGIRLLDNVNPEL